ncbi:hypothetical protein [Nocardia camponoti]|uniref:Uncharacterized protein n=1 Tax=Nocardia camponoti TaxID=1616106 RepID=A0A917QGW1_9NOCA|nr:hypothetical protein [Nocardia camponoti]GGK48420.1 hypothetical protein GCM10011591_19780 [Nocardia camponoti]
MAETVTADKATRRAVVHALALYGPIRQAQLRAVIMAELQRGIDDAITGLLSDRTITRDDRNRYRLARRYRKAIAWPPPSPHLLDRSPQLHQAVGVGVHATAPPRSGDEHTRR